MNGQYRWIYALFFFLLPLCITAQVTFEGRLDTNRMLIGDQHILSLSVQGTPNMQLDTISFRTWEETGFETLTPQQWQAEGNIYRQDLAYAIYDTGYIQLPPLELIFRYEDVSDTIYSNDLAVEVNGIMVDSTGLAPIKTIIREPLSFRDVAPYLIGLLLALLLVWFVWRMKRRSTPPEVIVEIPIPAHEKALKELAELQQQKLWQSGKIKAYQSELTRIIRVYLEGRFGILAMESTTEEILSDMRNEEISSDLTKDLAEILNMADLIKFAKAKPSVDIHQRFMELAEHFVRTTRVVEEIKESDD
ncbi:MAG: hypothetical protein HKN87_23680 [Saprospiraceae bacterium]|nr:hypothetical protein [Saprospiraceae bacterium]